jgi:hypothetical protein
MTRNIPDYVGEHFAKPRPSTLPSHLHPLIVCADGTLYSVQASEMHYCSPRTNEGPWTSFEVLPEFPTGRTSKIRGWVPKDTINRWIHRHGGVAK